MRHVVLAFLGWCSVSVCAANELDSIAREYVDLVLSIGEHDAAYVDAYYGPAEWLGAVKQRALTLNDLDIKLSSVSKRLATARVSGSDPMLKWRKLYLSKQLRAMEFRLRMLKGERSQFDQETAVLYDAVSPHHDREYYEALLSDLQTLLPGNGSLVERMNTFRQQFVIPREKLKTVMDAAIAGCREKTKQFIALPEGENFRLEFVTDRPWSGYNWYKGNYQSLIQINVEFPIYIDRAVDLGCHEGYPGHHTYNVLLEQKLVKERGWVEFSVYPLYSPQSMMAEGSANYGIAMAFPGASRTEFEREKLYPLADINPALAAQYRAVQEVLAKLSYADNEAARHYLDGLHSKQETLDWLINVSLYPIEKAPQRIRFYEVNRGYVINYNVGRDLIGDYIERNSAQESGDEAQARRWQLFTELLSSPQLPSSLK